VHFFPCVKEVFQIFKLCQILSEAKPDRAREFILHARMFVAELEHLVDWLHLEEEEEQVIPSFLLGLGVSSSAAL